MDEKTLNGMNLFISLTKDGCVWQGDVFSSKWSECLFIVDQDAYVMARVKNTLSAYTEGTDYRMEGDYAIWLA